jgi:hypothetical protein
VEVLIRLGKFLWRCRIHVLYQVHARYSSSGSCTNVMLPSSLPELRFHFRDSKSLFWFSSIPFGLAAPVTRLLMRCPNGWAADISDCVCSSMSLSFARKQQPCPLLLKFLDSISISRLVSGWTHLCPHPQYLHHLLLNIIFQGISVALATSLCQQAAQVLSPSLANKADTFLRLHFIPQT